jgi:hypothetical protein
MEKILQLFGLAPSEDEKKFLSQLGANAPKSIRVVGRGTLVMDAVEARATPGAKKFLEGADRIVR